MKARADNMTRRIIVEWGDGHRSAFPYIWLKHELFHPAAGRPDRIADGPCLVTEPSSAACVSDLNVAEGTIRIQWAHDGMVTEFSHTWLREHCVTDAARSERRHKPHLWSKAESLQFPWFDYDAINDPGRRLDLFVHIRDFGIGLVRGVPAAPGEVRKLASLLGPIRRTHFGDLFDIRSKPEDQGGTGANIGGTQSNSQAPHTDETWRHNPPGYSLFHCIKPDPGGRGASIYIDGIAAAERLRAKNPAAFALLASVPILWAAERNPHEKFRSRGRAIAVDHDGIVRGIRIADRTFPPLDLPENLIEPAYDALAAFRIELYDESRAWEKVLQAGECVIFDNQRVLHTRRFFDRQAGERWLQQVSVDRGEFQNTMRCLAKAEGRTELVRVEPDAGALAQPLIRHPESNSYLYGACE